jgi:hypothetical protein
MPFATLDLLARVVARRIERRPPFLGALGGLRVDDRHCRARFPAFLLANRNVQLVMDALQGAVPVS